MMVERQRNGVTGGNLIRGIHFSQTRSDLGACGRKRGSRNRGGKFFIPPGGLEVNSEVGLEQKAGLIVTFGAILGWGGGPCSNTLEVRMGTRSDQQI